MLDHCTSFLGLERLEVDLPALHHQYVAAEPYPHIVIDSVLSASTFADAKTKFPPIDDPGWMGYVHVNETKFANPHLATWNPILAQIAEALMSERFVRFLEALTGERDLLVDRSMDGGGLHQTLQGGHLNVHADFTTHHTNRNWRRRINVLLYLNDTWDPDWGGELELWHTDMSACARRVAPVGNRMLVFTTAEDSFHGHPDALRCPQGVARRSMALYYFTEEDRPRTRSTNYRARPGDGWKVIGISADRMALGLYDRLKRRLGSSDDVAEAVLRRLARTRASRRG